MSSIEQLVQVMTNFSSSSHNYGWSSNKTSVVHFVVGEKQKMVRGKSGNFVTANGWKPCWYIDLDLSCVFLMPDNIQSHASTILITIVRLWSESSPILCKAIVSTNPVLSYMESS